jgi:hypothetical protein
MWLFIKRAFLLILLLIGAGIGYLVAYENSEKFSTTIASLECTLNNASEGFFVEARDYWGIISFAQLKRDPLKSKVYLYWLEDGGESENGLQPRVTLKEDVNFYYGEEYIDYSVRIYRTFNRETLEYRRERKNENGQVQNWLTRSCVIVPNKYFEELRIKSAEATKAKQKI